jgi:hypothetical protein
MGKSPDSHPFTKKPSQPEVFGLQQVKKFVVGELMDFHLGKMMSIASSNNKENM